MPFYTITQTMQDGRVVTVADGEVSGDAMAKGLPIARTMPKDGRGVDVEVKISTSTNAMQWSVGSKVEPVIDPKNEETVKGG